MLYLIVKANDFQGLEQVLSKSYGHKKKCFRAWECCEKQKLLLEQQKVKMYEMETQMRFRKIEMEEVRARISFMKELRDLGHTPQEIEVFLAEQFDRGEGSSRNRQAETTTDDSDNSNTSDSSEWSSPIPLRTCVLSTIAIVSFLSLVYVICPISTSCCVTHNMNL